MALLDDLTSDDATTRALAVKQVRQTDLDDLDVLDAMLVACRDRSPLPDDMQPPPPEDPFADFFGESFSSAQPQRATIADSACERLIFTGGIGKPETVDHLAEALRDPECGEAFVKAAVKVLGQTQWADRLGAVGKLVPLLHAKDAPLYEIVARVGAPEHAVMIQSALDPYHSRGVNELLNHQPSKPMMEAALRDAAEAGRIEDEADAADVLSLMVAWNSEHAHPISVALEPRFPWALMVRAIDEPEAGPRLREWLEAGNPAPIGLMRKLEEGLKTLDDLPHYPLDAWMAYAGTGVAVARQWGAQARCSKVLEDFVARWDEAPDRAWSAVRALIEAGLHEAITDAIFAGLKRDEDVELWNRDRFEALAIAKPPIPGLLDAVADVLHRHPLLTRAVIPAMMRGYDAATLRPLAEAYIAYCEQQPVIRKPSRPGLIHEEREGVDPVPLQALVNALGDEVLIQRLNDVLPYVRPVEQD